MDALERMYDGAIPRELVRELDEKCRLLRAAQRDAEKKDAE